MTTIHSRHYGWDNALPPAAEVESGSDVEFDVVDASGGQIDARSPREVLGSLDFARINPVTGPIFVKGAKPGDTLEVEIRSLRTSRWGWTGIIPGFGLLADEYPEPWLRIWDVDGSTATGIRGARVPVRPFPGTIGVALAERGAHSIVPPRQNGGNMDIRHLVQGVRLLLPVWVDGALFSVGDTHAAQGDGEVCGTAIESPMGVALRFTVHRGMTLAAPQYVVPAWCAEQPDPRGYHVTTGIAEDLREAARSATRHMVEHLTLRYAYSREEAYALCSVCVDLRISEVVDAPNWLVSAFLPLSVLAS
ncbi:MAG: acetamidase/formamidase family protein [Chloroflexota bacterium]|nr:acetamidase/formamidase family protein [Chloroflexota bacterium]